MPEPEKYALTKTAVLIPGTIGLYQEVRRFSDAAIQASVEAALARIPVGTKRGLVSLGVDPVNGLKLAGALRLSGMWSIAGAFAIKSEADWALGVEIMGGWE